MKSVDWRALIGVMIGAAIVAGLQFLSRPPAPPTPATKPAEDVAPLMESAPGEEAAATLTLTGNAVSGVDEPRPARLASGEEPKQTVKLGRAPMPDDAKAMIPPLPMKAGPVAAPPASTGSRRSKATSVLKRMYLNDRMGCCVISGKYHQLGFTSAVDGGPEIEVPDATIAQQYNLLKAGRGDTGCIITDVLRYYQRNGIPANGVSHKLDGWVAVNARSTDQLKAAIYLFGTVTLGVDLPQAWTSSAVWDVTNSRIVGGHDVAAVDYDDQGVYVSSWGKVYRVTWAAMTNGRYVKECYAQLHAGWTGSDRLAPSGVNDAQLKLDLDVIRNGGVPDHGDTPPPGPTPPVDPPIPAAGFVITEGDLLPDIKAEFHRQYPYRNFRLELPAGK